MKNLLNKTWDLGKMFVYRHPRLNTKIAVYQILTDFDINPKTGMTDHDWLLKHVEFVKKESEERKRTMGEMIKLNDFRVTEIVIAGDVDPDMRKVKLTMKKDKYVLVKA